MVGININDGSIHRGFAGSKTVSFKVSLDAPSDVLVTAKIAAREWERVRGLKQFAVNRTDFDAAEFDLTFEPGETSKDIDVTVYGFETGDPLKRGPKEFELRLLDQSNAVAGRKPIGVGVILYGE